MIAFSSLLKAVNYSFFCVFVFVAGFSCANAKPMHLFEGLPSSLAERQHYYSQPNYYYPPNYDFTKASNTHSVQNGLAYLANASSFEKEQPQTLHTRAAFILPRLNMPLDSSENTEFKVFNIMFSLVLLCLLTYALGTRKRDENHFQRMRL